MTNNKESHIDEVARVVCCKECGHPLQFSHGITHMNTVTGENWWQCTNKACNRRIKEVYALENEIIITKSIEEVRGSLNEHKCL